MEEATEGKGMARVCAAFAVAAGLAIPGSAFAQQSEAERIRELEKKLEKSLELIDQLSRRVNELEKSQTPPAPLAPRAALAPPAPAPAQEARIEALEKSVSQMASAGTHDMHGGGDGVPIHGFADVQYQRFTLPRADNRTSGFAIDNLDFFITPNFGRVKMLAELNFEVNAGGALDTDLERLQLGYTFTDAATLWMGRFHTPYGYWNTAFHHGAQIQVVTRPRFVDFEDKGGVLPAHSVGLWATGRMPAGPGKFQYDAYFANGSRILDGVVDFNAMRDDNGNKAVGGNVGYRFGGALDGLLVGLHGLREEVDVYNGDALAAKTRLAFVGGYYYLDMDPWESIAEYYRFRNQDLSGDSGTHNSWAAFLQLGYTLAERWTPYYRWEQAELSQSDPYFTSQVSGNPYKRHVVGLKYALNPNTALKLEANTTRERFGPEEKKYTETRAQFAVRF